MKRQLPKVRREERDGVIVSEHPAFGQISVSRVSCQTRLYGSDFDHHNFISLTISESEEYRDLSREWHFARKELIRVDMSDIQWAQFVSSMNMGGGVPCTLTRVDGALIPGIATPFETKEALFDREAKETLERARKGLDSLLMKLKDLKLSNKAYRELSGEIGMVRSALGSSLSFVLKSFNEYMEKTVGAAKAEVDAHIMVAALKVGLGEHHEIVRTLLGHTPSETEKSDPAVTFVTDNPDIPMQQVDMFEDEK